MLPMYLLWKSNTILQDCFQTSLIILHKAITSDYECNLWNAFRVYALLVMELHLENSVYTYVRAFLDFIL